MDSIIAVGVILDVRVRVSQLDSESQTDPNPRRLMFPVEAEQLIPHRAPMRMIDELIEIEDDTGRARVRFGRDHLGVAGGRVMAAALVECMAQTMAAMQGYIDRNAEPNNDVDEEDPGLGMLTGVSNFEVHFQPEADAELIISVTERKKLGRMHLIAGEIRCDGRIVAEGELKLYG